MRDLTVKCRMINMTRFVILMEKSHHNQLPYLSECLNQGQYISLAGL